MIRHPLDGSGWTLHGSGACPAAARGPLPAVVPGCVHADLIRAGVIEHPDLGFAERVMQWIGHADWSYTRGLATPDAMLEHDRLQLVCAALDTVATIAVNERIVAQTATMFAPQRVDVRELLADGPARLEIRIRGPLAHVDAERRRLGDRPYNGVWGAYPFARKMACNFGWDWGPMVATAGLVGPVMLEAWSVARLAGVRPLVVEATPEHAEVRVVVDVERVDAGQSPLELHVRLDGPDGDRLVERRVAVDPAAVTAVTLRIDRPRRWWPRGHGPQPLHRLTVRLEAGRAELDVWRGRLGLRTVALDTTADEIGSRFVVQVNGRDVFCRGANWIPNDVLPAPVDRRAIVRRVTQAAAANMTMLRVWGGGRYEDEAFYDACDELGILVWQDFMFACATYPEEPPYPALVEAEARHQVARLARHPSVTLWCGGNENIWAHASWGFGERLRPGQSWGEGYWRHLLPSIVEELDPSRPYWPDSPWSNDAGAHPQDPDHGDRHSWHETQQTTRLGSGAAGLEAYRDLVPRFASELGHQGPPCLATLRRALGPDDLAIAGEAMRHRQRAAGGSTKWYDVPLAAWFGSVRTFEGWHYLAQLLQARAMATAIEWHRASWPRCAGVLFWQLNDCWAGHSWSAIDVDGRRKLMWYAARRAFADRVLTIQPRRWRGGRGGYPAVVLVNDRDEPWTADVTIRRLAFDGTELATDRRPLHAAPRSVTWDDTPHPVVRPRDPGAELLVAEVAGSRAWWFYARDRHLDLPRPRYELTQTVDGRTTRVRITARTLVRDLALMADGLDPSAEVDDQLVTLLPGESHDFVVTSESRIEAARGLWCVGEEAAKEQGTKGQRDKGTEGRRSPEGR